MRPGDWRRSAFTESPKRSDAYSKRLFNASLERCYNRLWCIFSYKIVPLGSYSRIEELPPSKSTYELYASSDMTPARLLQNRRFNHAMVAFLECLRQLLEFGKKHGKQWAQANIE